MDLTKFSSLAKIESECEIAGSFKISMHTLSVVQQQEALAELPTSPIGQDVALRTIILQQALLVYAIDSIDGNKVSLQEKKDFIQNLQAPIFNEIYNWYDQMAQKQDSTLVELNKKKVN